jgi:hypothetical protein
MMASGARNGVYLSSGRTAYPSECQHPLIAKETKQPATRKSTYSNLQHQQGNSRDFQGPVETFNIGARTGSESKSY